MLTIVGQYEKQACGAILLFSRAWLVMKNRQGKIGVLVNPYLIGALHKIAVATYKIPRLSFEARLIEYDFAHTNITGEAREDRNGSHCFDSSLQR